MGFGRARSNRDAIAANGLREHIPAAGRARAAALPIERVGVLPLISRLSKKRLGR